MRRLALLAIVLGIGFLSLSIRVEAQGYWGRENSPTQASTYTTISVKEAGVKKFSLISPAADATYKIGEQIEVNPYFNPAGDHRIVNYYLIDSRGLAHLIHMDSWNWCGTGSHHFGSSPATNVLGLSKFLDGSLITPGDYNLVIAYGGHGQGQSSSTIVGEVLARSSTFHVVEARAMSVGTVSGSVSIDGLDSDAKKELFNRIVAIYLDSLDEQYRQVKINPEPDGSFRLSIQPGNYTVELRLAFSGSDRHAFFRGGHFLLNPAPAKKIHVAAGTTTTLNFRLVNQDPVGQHESFMNYRVEQLE